MWCPQVLTFDLVKVKCNMLCLTVTLLYLCKTYFGRIQIECKKIATGAFKVLTLPCTARINCTGNVLY